MKKKLFLVSMILTVSTLLCACGAEKEPGKGKDQADETVAEQETDKDSEKETAERNSISAGIDETTTSKYGECGPDLMWYLDEMDGILVIRGTGNMSFSTYETPWYQFEDDIHQLVIEEGCTTIAKDAFRGCHLESAVLPDTLTAIGEFAFSSCQLESITIPDSVTEIGEFALSGNEFEEIEIPKGITKIEDNTYSGNKNLRSVIIPDTITFMGGGAFRDCESLESVTISENVTTIGQFAFYNCKNLKSITIPNSVTTIEGQAFSGCENLESVTLSENLTSIESLFGWCKSLKEITIPKSVASIDRGAFCESGLEKMIIENADIECDGLQLNNGRKNDRSVTVIIAGEEQEW